MKNNNSRYFQQAKSRSAERFLGVDGFNSMNNFMRADGTTTATTAAATVQSYTPTTSAPYEFQVENANGSPTLVSLFNSFQSRTANNFGQVSGITITSTIDGVDYGALLAQTETKNFECGMTYIETVTGSNSVITATWSLVSKNADGNFTTATKSPKKSPMQQQTDVLQYENIFQIDGYTAIRLVIPANTTVKYSFYPSATVMPGRVLSGVPQLMGYSQPEITPATVTTLSPASVAALVSSRG